MRNNKTLGFILNSILNLLIVIFTIFLLFSIYTTFQVKVLKNDYANFFGYSLFEIQTGSMHGTLEVGDWIVVKNTNDYKIGDIVTFKQNGNFITHRIVESYNETFVTKGDANNAKDEAIDKSQIVGKVTKEFKGVGILRKTIFNPFVIIALLITIYLFNKTFKKELNDTKKLLESAIEKESKTVKSVKIETPELKEKEKEEIKIVKDMVEKEKLSETAVFRYISVEKPDVETKPEVQPKKTEEELSKTSFFRIIKVNSDDVKESTKVKPKREKTVKAEVIEKKEEVKSIDEVLLTRFKSKKSINIVDKYFFVKKVEIDELLNDLLKDEKKYIQSSTFRKKFVDFYINEKYYSTDKERKNFKKSLIKFKDELIKDNVRNENKTKAIEAYYNAINIISDIEDGNELKENNDSIQKIIEVSNNYMNELVEQFSSSTFELITSKITGQKNMYGAYLTHNLSFSKVYSDYIVDKTYNEGIVNEDKLSVLLNLILVKIVKNLMDKEYNNKYIFYIPPTLYEKDKKLDKTLTLINDEYSLNHIYVLSSLSNMLNNKDDFTRLRKKGYLFALNFDKSMKLKGVDTGYIEMCDLYFVDSSLQTTDIYESIPSSIISAIIKDNINKKTGNTGGK